MRKVVFFALLAATGLRMQALPYAPQPTGSEAAAGTEEYIKFGKFDSWLTREVHESKLLGGKTVTLYEVAPSAHWTQNKAYANQGGSPWATSNVYAKVAGIVKSNISVYKEARPGHGSCAKLYTHLVQCKVLGMVNIKVLAAGSLFLGEIQEPISGVGDPMKKLDCGMKINRRPKAVRFDYKVKLSGEKNRIRKGTGSQTTVAGIDMCDCYAHVQKRWEDSKGNIHALRLGTMGVRWSKNTSDWVNDATYEIHYGDISKSSYFQSFMKLNEVQRYAKNSKGKMVPVVEEGWGSESDQPTHLVLAFDSSHGGAYVGSVGNTLWVDNVRLVY
ncbi:MAG: PCMD domain-containing protein [Bacteroidaceae bacterium]|nr:PCMD domain-containing protein [Bacteroidaceae bacterium]